MSDTDPHFLSVAAAAAMEVAALAFQLRAVVRSPELNEFQRDIGRRAILVRITREVERYPPQSWKLLLEIVGVGASAAAMIDAANSDDEAGFQAAQTSLDAGLERWEALDTEMSFAVHTEEIAALIAELRTREP